ncbi:aldehyde dehydrogenase (NAD+) [Halobacillus karajensis]|uniref:Salicylaldehyde dehydrogenase n=1 Tax=Halobacillus karajensis TaxID=195088 RepID=A0A024P8M4_9BACI|nr:aldehyde dehydrogenase family protein [Halobacillus karajensis]CDQ21555.1 Putative aldehyde dehydrogenase YfmT [Halobacillus karajensis]CDQ25489.1 Putative aldehyde dehydrogenase YfmT [Halobacillus karajensis]CDQ28980.1 Putative aldehyde dehydrogenase YfmT [Halobacillus karajensis]SEI09028.1 aldehyde dehydrogenase (NAD+) [Halobacillus karajensis]
MSPQTFTKQYINGHWINGSSEKYVDNINPYTQQTIASIPSANEDDLNKAYQAALNSQGSWMTTAPGEKRACFDQLLKVVYDRKDEIIDWLVKEAGSTLVKAEVEFQAAVGIIRESAGFPTRMSGQILPSNTPGKENRIYRSPKGVIGVIGPWNFPFHLAMRSIAPAIATGNTVVVKSASDAPVTSGLLIADLFEEAGFPEGALNVVVGRGAEIGDAFVKHPAAKLISFTGSTEIGSHIGELAGKHIKETALELGGNNAMLVLDDADIDQAVEAAAFGKFLHQGQICMSLNRIIIHENIHDIFVEKFKEKVESLKAGDPSEKDTVIGPLINKEAVERIQENLKESIGRGAEIVTGGEADGNVMQPTVLSGVTNDMPIAKNEIFGPVAAVIKVVSETEAIEVANSSPYGLSGSIFTRDVHRGVEVAKRVETGMIHINDQSVNDEAHVAFGGEKESGLGRFGGEWALEKFTTVKWIGVMKNGYRYFPF